MANITTLIPTKNKENWNIDEIELILRNYFPNITFEKNQKLLQISIFKNSEIITKIYFNQEYFIDYKSNKNELRERGKYDLANKLEELEKMHPELDRCIELTYGIGKYIKEKSEIEKVIINYFDAYLFDEGIDPEFIPPDYTKNNTAKNNNLITKFKNFFK